MRVKDAASKQAAALLPQDPRQVFWTTNVERALSMDRQSRDRKGVGCRRWSERDGKTSRGPDTAHQSDLYMATLELIRSIAQGSLSSVLSNP